MGIEIDWRRKKIWASSKIDAFPGRCFFITYYDFKNSGGFPKLIPHYLSDYDFSMKLIKKGIKVREMDSMINHPPHPQITGLKM